MSGQLAGEGSKFAEAGQRPLTLREVLAGADEPGARRPWYQRRASLLAVVVALVIAVAVVTDLPRHTSSADAIAQGRSVIESINGDAIDCTTSVSEALRLRRYALEATLPASDRARIPGLLRDDEAACTLTNNDTFSLAGIEVPGSASGRDLGQVVDLVYHWTTSDAVAAIIAIEQLTASPASERNRRDLAALDKALRLAAADRAEAFAEVRAAGAELKAKLPYPAIPALSKAPR